MAIQGASPPANSHGRVALPDLVPARMLNEFAYCPRLAYLEWVQGEARARELARLLAGQPDRPEALEHARALLGI